MQRPILALLFLGLIACAFATTTSDGTVVVAATADTTKDATIVGSTTTTADQSLLFTFSSASSLSPFWMAAV